jgi:apolipoprotein N-acyltransferase
MNTPRTMLFSQIVAFLAGCGLPLAFAPFDFFPMSFISLLLLFKTWHHATAKQAAWYGFLFGIGYFGVGISWVYISFTEFGGVHWAVSALVTAALIGFLSLYPASIGWISHRWGRKLLFIRYLLIIPALWAGMEWVRSWLLSGFPWLSLGYSQFHSPLIGFAPVLGVYGVSWLVVLSAAGLFYLLQSRSVINILSIFIGIVAIWVAGWQLQTVTWTHPVGKPLRVALIQANTPDEFKIYITERPDGMPRYLELAKQQQNVDLIILPETAINVFYHEARSFLLSLYREYQQKGVSFISGVPVLRRDGSYLNGVVTIGKDIDFYYKYHLVPFGEYIPFQRLFGKIFELIDVPMSDFSWGEFQQPNLHAAGQEIGMSICFEDAFPEQVRNAMPNATILANVSNDSWFANSLAPHQHLEIAQMRALELGRYLLRATNTGISAVIDTHGHIIDKTQQFKIQVLHATAQPHQGLTPFGKYGNSGILGITFLSLLLGMLGNFIYTRPTISNILNLNLPD